MMKVSVSQSDYLNVARWVAAWLVVAEHVRSLCFVDYSQLTNTGYVTKAFYFLTGFGHEAVVLFFVISGYLVGGKACQLFRSDRFSWRRYLVDRTSRLYAVLLVALVFGFVLDWCGASYFDGYGLYAMTYEGLIAVLNYAPVERLNAPTLLQNALFLQTLIGPTSGSNGPLWSLAYEWWYYILFPGILFVFVGPIWKRMVIGIGLLLLMTFLSSHLLILFGVWIFGVLVSLLNRPLLPFWITLPLAGLALFLARIEIIHLPFADAYLIGVSFALSLQSLVSSSQRWPMNRMSHTLADFSYSVYLLHFPVIMFVVSAMFAATGFGIRMQPEPLVFAWFFSVFGISIACAYAVSLFTEKKTANLRNALYRLVGVDRKSVVV